MSNALVCAILAEAQLRSLPARRERYARLSACNQEAEAALLALRQPVPTPAPGGMPGSPPPLPDVTGRWSRITEMEGEGATFAFGWRGGVYGRGRAVRIADGRERMARVVERVLVREGFCGRV